MKEYQVYCLRCKENRKVVDPKIIEMPGKGKSTRTAITGKCEKCSVNIYRTIKKEDNNI